MGGVEKTREARERGNTGDQSDGENNKQGRKEKRVQKRVETQGTV